MIEMRLDNLRIKPEVLVIGDVLTDIVVHLDEPLIYASDTRSSIQLRPGGSGANMAVWLAQTGQVKVHLVGRVGQDLYAEFHRSEFIKAGVVPHLAIDNTVGTGTIIVLVEPGSGERSMLSDRGANAQLEFADIPTALLRSSQHLHVSGYALFEAQTRAATLKAMALAQEDGLTISLDPSSASMLAKVGRAAFLEWTAGVTLLFPNLEEGQLLSGESELQAILEVLTHYYQGVALKLGKGGAIWGEAGDLPPLSQPATSPHQPDSSTTVDTTGAGDAFCAGFLSQWLLDSKKIAAALEAGADLAGQATQIVGARPLTKD